MVNKYSLKQTLTYCFVDKILETWLEYIHTHREREYAHDLLTGSNTSIDGLNKRNIYL